MKRLPLSPIAALAAAALLLCSACTANPQDGSAPDSETPATTAAASASAPDSSAGESPADSSAADTTAAESRPASSGSRQSSGTTAKPQPQPAGSSSVSQTTATTAASFGTVDLMDKVIAASGYKGTGLKGQKVITIGERPFADYSLLHGNPLETAPYVLGARKLAAGIKNTSAGLDTFCLSAVKSYGFKLDISASYTVYTNIDQALTALFKAAGDESSLAAAKKQAATLAADVKTPVAKWLSAAAYAYSLTAAQLSSVTDDDFKTLCSFAYCTPASGDTALLSRMIALSKKVSEKDMLRAGTAMVKATGELARALTAGKAVTAGGKALTIPTPAGNLVFGTTGKDTYSSPDALLLIDPAGSDTYKGRVAADSSRKHPISVVIDLSGDDTYTAGAADGPSQGAGVLGTGILFDMAGNDIYTAERLAQGCALLGVGVLFDGKGDDNYTCHVTGQASGLYGLAVLADTAGKDRYEAYAFAQASAGTRAMCYLIDSAGNDAYKTAYNVEKGYESLDYGQFPGVNGNWSQGCGWGQRVVDTGHQGVAGGIAGLIDLAGNDTYAGAIWVQGVGYWSGVGFLFDGKGNDKYYSSYYSQSSVAHYGAAALIDVGGDDEHDVSSRGIYAGGGASVGFVWDHGTALFINDGGNDIYTASQTAFGCADSYYDGRGDGKDVDKQETTYAVFIDTVGDDFYVGGSLCWGFGRGGYFIDAGGSDHYISSQVGFLPADNELRSDTAQMGGVCLDYSVTRETPAAPRFSFWETAKKLGGIS